MKKAIIVIVLVIATLAGCYKKGATTNRSRAVPAVSWHSLVVGQRLFIDDSTFVERVPGGWVWNHDGSYGESAVFVPYTKEGE